jgi:hypothetical protein
MAMEKPNKTGLDGHGKAYKNLSFDKFAFNKPLNLGFSMPIKTRFSRLFHGHQDRF